MIHFKIYYSVNELPKSWDSLAIHNIFLHTTMLKGLECSYPSNISVYYLGVFKNDILIGIAVLQRVQMYLESVFRNNTTFIKQKITMLISKIAKGNILVLGNLMHTGQHGFYFNPKVITYTAFLNIIYKGINTLVEQIKVDFGKTIRLIAFKDFFINDTINKEIAFLKKHKLYTVEVQPNMIFNLNTSWCHINDYKLALNKKYKHRLATALKKKQGVVLKPMSLENIKTNEKALFKLYKSVSDKALINSFVLPENHFYNLKKNLQDKFQLYGYFLNNELIGFFTLIKNNTSLETYFLGYNTQLNHTHQIYLNMLYDMVKIGIESSFNKIIFARTAMEIKSSIGAKPFPMILYVKHKNNYIANIIFKGAVNFINPLKPWKERNPFRV